MTLFPRLRDEERSAVSWAELADGWLESHRAKSGASVSEETAAGLDAVGAVLGLFSDVLSMLPLAAFRDTSGSPTKINRAPQIVSSPSAKVDARTWRAQAAVSWLLWGNVYAYVTSRDALGYPTGAEILHPDSVEVIETGALSLPTYKLDGRAVPNDRIIHRPGRWVRPGSCVGVAPLTRFRETIGMAIAARDFAAGWFGEGAHPSGVLETEHKLDQDQVKLLKERFMAAIRGREPVAMGFGVKYKPVQVNPKESLLTEQQMGATVAVARAFGVQPEMIGASTTGQNVTYANREQRAIDFLTFSADPWLVRFEDMLTDQLPRPQYVKFNRGALLRTDIITRYKAHDISVRGGWQNRDEIRVHEEQGPIPDGDLYLWPPGRTTPEADPGGTNDGG